MSREAKYEVLESLLQSAVELLRAFKTNGREMTGLKIIFLGVRLKYDTRLVLSIKSNSLLLLCICFSC